MHVNVIKATSIMISFGKIEKPRSLLEQMCNYEKDQRHQSISKYNLIHFDAIRCGMLFEKPQNNNSNRRCVDNILLEKPLFIFCRRSLILFIVNLIHSSTTSNKGKEKLHP